MSSRLVDRIDYPAPDRVRDLMRDARREQAETVAELFGFGFTVVRDAVKSRHERQSVVADLAAVTSSRG